MSTQERAQPVEPGSQGLRSPAPYEGTILKALDKLTSEIFIFLLAYLMLIIGLAVLAPGLSSEFRVLLHVLPILGVATYVVGKRRRLQKEAQARGLGVWSGVATGAAHVIGQRGQSASPPDQLKLISGIATDNAEVIGIDAGHAGAGDDVSERYLLEQFRKLNQRDRQRLIADALRLTVRSAQSSEKADD